MTINSCCLSKVCNLLHGTGSVKRVERRQMPAKDMVEKYAKLARHRLGHTTNPFKFL